MINRYPLWKNILLIATVVLGLIYAAPNLYSEDPSLQISATNGAIADAALKQQIETILQQEHLSYKTIQLEQSNILVRFKEIDTQLKAKDVITGVLGDNYTTALNLAPTTPHWLSMLGAEPMKWGLDLRGGIYFSLDVDVDGVVKQRNEGMLRNMGTELREADIRYTDLAKQPNGGIMIRFGNSIAMDAAYALLRKHFNEMEFKRDHSQLIGRFLPSAINNIRQAVVEETMTTLRNRVNELGIAEAVVQQQGGNRITVELPGILDSARAKQILGGTSTLEFHMADSEHDVRSVVGGIVPTGTTLYMYDKTPVLLKSQVILTGNSIRDAQASYGEDGRSAVEIRLGGGGEALFHKMTAQNVGKPMAIVFVESKVENENLEGKPVKVRHKVERVISVATIKSALGNQFQITGLRSQQESQNLALLLRAGALPAAIDIVEERTLGPKLGMENIKKGVLSIEVGMGLVMLFMAFYYRLFGLVANVGLLINLVLLVALLSILGMTLTLPGIAGIVLNLGMAVDANVLIFERIREELRNGASPQASIHAGYERAFNTIVDANITTLIVALVLFGLGTGAIKGFAVTLSLGILTSMLSGIAITRAMVNVIYGGRNIKRLSIGI